VLVRRACHRVKRKEASSAGAHGRQNIKNVLQVSKEVSCNPGQDMSRSRAQYRAVLPRAACKSASDYKKSLWYGAQRRCRGFAAPM